MMASINGHLDIVKYLVEKDVDINMYNGGGFTTLMLVTQQGNLEIVKYLVENGADISIVEHYEGYTALDIARDLENPQINRKIDRKF